MSEIDIMHRLATHTLTSVRRRLERGARVEGYTTRVQTLAEQPPEMVRTNPEPVLADCTFCERPTFWQVYGSDDQWRPWCGCATGAREMGMDEEDGDGEEDGGHGGH